MKCRACDCILTDHEATKKDSSTGEYVDLCDSCAGIVAADLAENNLPSPNLELDDPHFVAIEEEIN